MEIQKNSPSNIRTGWSQKFFYKVEQDGVLNEIIKIFANYGNQWSMSKGIFDKIVSATELDKHPSFDYVSKETLEIKGESIYFKENIIKALLLCSYKWSLRNFVKNAKKNLPRII